MVHVLDSVWSTDGNRTFGDFMNILNLMYPTSVEAGTPFEITYDAQNAAAEQLNAFGYIFDFSTQQQVPGSYWEATVDAGASNPIIVEFSGITDTFSGEIRIGHIEGEISCSNPAGSEGQFVCGDSAYPNAPTRGHRYSCVDGTWVDQGIDTANCPTGGGGINPMYLMAGFAAILVVGVVFIAIKK